MGSDSKYSLSKQYTFVMMKQNCQQLPDTRKPVMARSNTVRKYLIGRSYKNDQSENSSNQKANQFCLDFVHVGHTPGRLA